MEYVLNVLVLLKLVEKFFELCALLLGYFFEVVGDAFKFGAHDFKSFFFEIILDVGELL